MTTTQETKNIAAALAKAQSAMKPAEFDKVNPAFKSRYATLASIFEACRLPLTANGIAVVQGVEAEGSTVRVTTTLLHVSGESLTSTLTLTATQGTPQGIGSAITYGRRYGISALVGVVADEDDDANAASTKPDRSGSRVGPKPEVVTPETMTTPKRDAEQRKRDIVNELKAMGYEPAGVSHFVKETLGHDKAKDDTDLDKLESAIVIVRAAKNADKEADLNY